MKSNPLNAFFNLGNKVTKNDPVRKAKFDYYLYWIVFLAFLFVAINYYYSFFTTWKFSSLMWALILSGISWFNYWGLIGFKTMYDGQKRASESLKKLDTPKDNNSEVKLEDLDKEFDDETNPNDMLKSFGDEEK